MNNTAIVVARFNENINWLRTNFNSDTTIIYNKGYKINDPIGDIKILPRSNKPACGREPETYIHHIISNYNNLHDYTIFTQGDPFKHSPKFIEIVNYLNSTNSWKNYQPLSCMWIAGSQVPPLDYIEYDQTCFIDNTYPVVMETIDMDLKQVFYPDYGIYPTLKRFKDLHRLKVTDKIVPYLGKFLDLEHKIKVNFLKFNFGAIFGVKKENILQHPLSFYEKLYKFSITDISHAYVLERLWYTIFY